MTLIEFHPLSNSHIIPGSPEAPEADTRCGNEFQTSVGFPTAASSSFLHVPVEKAGGSKTILNPPFLPASPGAFGISQLPKCATFPGSVWEGGNDWQLPSAGGKGADKGGAGAWKGWDVIPRIPLWEAVYLMNEGIYL